MLNKKVKKYLITEDDLYKILTYGSNHPRRKKFFSKWIIKKDNESIMTPKIVNVWEINKRSNRLNIVIGDSHGEFFTRYYESVINQKKIKPYNLSLAFWTGPSTLIGSILSSTYYDTLKESLIIIIESVKKLKFDIKRINLIISLGEIDVRSKIPLEVLRTKKNYKDVIDEYINDSYSFKLNSLVNSLSSFFKDLDIYLYFKIPTPPSYINFESPLNYEDALSIIKLNPYPNIGNIKYRLNIYNYLVNKIISICSENEIRILENKDCYENSILEKNASHDGCHISKGDWALFNCSQIIEL